MFCKTTEEARSGEIIFYDAMLSSVLSVDVKTTFGPVAGQHRANPTRHQDAATPDNPSQPSNFRHNDNDFCQEQNDENFVLCNNVYFCIPELLSLNICDEL